MTQHAPGIGQHLCSRATGLVVWRGYPAPQTLDRYQTRATWVQLLWAGITVNRCWSVGRLRATHMEHFSETEIVQVNISPAIHRRAKSSSTFFSLHDNQSSSRWENWNVGLNGQIFPLLFSVNNQSTIFLHLENNDMVAIEALKEIAECAAQEQTCQSGNKPCPQPVQTTLPTSDDTTGGESMWHITMAWSCCGRCRGGAVEARCLQASACQAALLRCLTLCTDVCVQ